MNTKGRISAGILLSCAAFAGAAFGQVKLTLEQAIDLAIRQNHNLLAARTNIQQNLAQEVTANLRPNPTFFVDWEYLPLFKTNGGFLDYLHDSTEGDIGMSYMFERGEKRQHRLEAAQDATAVTRSQVSDNERSLAFQVAQFFINAQLAQSTLDLARQDLKSFQDTIEISARQRQIGALSENDFLKIKLQLAQFQTDVEQAGLSKAQALSDLRQQLGYESVPADYDVTGPFDYQPLAVKLEELQTKALQNRPDLRAAVLGVKASNSQYTLAKANGKQDYTVSGNYSHVNGLSALTFSFSIPMPIFDRNQGEIARTRYAMNQAKEQQSTATGQVLTDVKDAYEGLRTNDRLVQIYRSGVLEDSQAQPRHQRIFVPAGRHRFARLPGCRAQLSCDAVGLPPGSGGVPDSSGATAPSGGNTELALMARRPTYRTATARE